MAYYGARPVCKIDVCINCGKCTEECPADALYELDNFVAVDVEKCCNETCDGECWVCCPVEAFEATYCNSEKCVNKIMEKNNMSLK